MPAQLTSSQVWMEIERQMFAVIGMVTAKGESRTAGIVYMVRDGILYFCTGTDAWKTRHLRHNPHVSLTVTISKRVPLVPWIKIPPATVTFPGSARVLTLDQAPPEIPDKLLRGLEPKAQLRGAMSVVEVVASGHFVTYGVGVSLKAMLNPVEAASRVPVG